MERRGRREPREREEHRFNIEAWVPRTSLGKDVKAKKITSIEEIYREGKSIGEPEIIDALLPELKSEVIEIASVQRMTKNNRKMKFRVTAIVGDGRGHVGVGTGKNVEVKAAIESATIDAKGRVIPLILGCGSWQCQCGTRHSLPFIVKGSSGSVDVILKPAPRGLGVVASTPVRKMLELAGVKDIWTFSRGRTRSKYNTLLAVYNALQSINSMKNISESVIKE